MTLTLDPTTEQRIQRELVRGRYRDAAELVAHAVDLLEAEGDWLVRNRDAINAGLDLNFAEAERGEGYSPEEARGHAC